LISLEELAGTARRLNDDNAELYEELSRQANVNRTENDVAGFCLNVMGGKPSDLFTKALSKSLKIIDACLDNSNNSNTNRDETREQPQSPIMHLYNTMPS